MANTRRWRGEAGEIIGSWLLQLLVIMAIVAAIGYEVIAVAVTAVNLEDKAREVAQEVAPTYDRTRDLAKTTEAAEEIVDERGLSLIEVTVEGNNLYVRVSEQASTWLIQRFSAFDTITHPTARGRANWNL